MDAYEEWDRRTAALLEEAYVAAGPGPGGSGASDDSEGAWRAKRQHLAVPMDADGTWLDVGCANAHLLVTLPAWAAERGITISPHGLEVLPLVADLARAVHPELADVIWTGSVMTWDPPQRFRYVTALDDAVPPEHLGALVERLLEAFVEPGGRLVMSTYTNAGEQPRPLFDDLGSAGHPPHGTIRIDRPGASPLLTAWIDR
ncbi:MAG TPA: hypothetical protein VJ804_05325 [Acidimicrobiales bacterium]|nr:hypothetical protein [Acidimicrobiales bacterium]